MEAETTTEPSTEEISPEVDEELTKLREDKARLNKMLDDMVQNIASVERDNKALQGQIKRYKDYLGKLSDHMRKIGFELAKVRDDAKKQVE